MTQDYPNDNGPQGWPVGPYRRWRLLPNAVPGAAPWEYSDRDKEQLDPYDPNDQQFSDYNQGVPGQYAASAFDDNPMNQLPSDQSMALAQRFSNPNVQGAADVPGIPAGLGVHNMAAFLQTPAGRALSEKMIKHVQRKRGR